MGSEGRWHAGLAPLAPAACRAAFGGAGDQTARQKALHDAKRVRLFGDTRLDAAQGELVADADADAAGDEHVHTIKRMGGIGLQRKQALQGAQVEPPSFAAGRGGQIKDQEVPAAPGVRGEAVTVLTGQGEPAHRLRCGRRPEAKDQ